MVLQEKGQTVNRGKNEHVRELQLEIGKTISEKRISKGLSIAQVEARTKISHSFISDIELGNFERLPGKLFGRGFVKNICKYLDIDTEAILEKYEKSWVYTPEVVKERTKSSPFSFFLRERGNKLAFSPSIFGNFSFNRLALILLVPISIVLLVFFIRYLTQERSSDLGVSINNASERVEPAPAAGAPAPSPVVENTAQVQAPIMLLPAVKDEAKDLGVVKLNPTKPIIETKKLELEVPKKAEAENSMIPDNKSLVILTVKEDVKIKLRVLPDEYAMTTFTPGVYRFAFEDRMDIHVFDPSAVELSFNGKNLGVLGKKGEERKLTFSAKDLSIASENKVEASKDATQPGAL